jgi:hypothetical protein
MTRSRAVALQLFRTKSPDLLIAEGRIPLESLWIESFGQGACFGRECSIPDQLYAFLNSLYEIANSI